MEDFSKNIFSPYYHKGNAAGIAINLIRFSVSNFNQCDVLKELDYLESTLSRKLTRADIEKIGKIAFNKPVDYFRIIFCFENYCKAILLVNSYLINNIENTETSNEIKKMSKNQKNKPILLNDFLAQSHWKKDTSGLYYLDFLKKETITFSTILKDSYMDVIKLPSKIIDFLRVINFERNNIHYFASLSFSNSIEFINNLRLLNSFVNNDMILFNDNLVIENKNIPNRHIINEFKRKIMDK